MKQIKCRRFNLDRSLGYLIQESTKDSTQEILGYFYGIASFVLEDLAKTSKAQFLDKDIVLFYKETPISYRIRIIGSGPGRYAHREGNPGVDISVTFPKDADNFDVAELMNAVVESGLGLTDEQNMPSFERPTLKTPKCLRDVRRAQNEQRTKVESSSN